jgi:hypothetical protein
MDLDLEILFTRTESEDQIRSEAEYPEIPRHTSVLRCKCGGLIRISVPAVCSNCQEAKGFWTMIDGSIIKLSDMKLDHLTNCIKLISDKIESYPPEAREKLEIALDIMYLELGSRDAEIKQANGIMGALRRSLDNAK